MLRLFQCSLLAKELERGAANDAVLPGISSFLACSSLLGPIIGQETGRVPYGDAQLRVEGQVADGVAEVDGGVPYPALLEGLEGRAVWGCERLVGRVEAEGEVKRRVWSAGTRAWGAGQSVSCMYAR